MVTVVHVDDITLEVGQCLFKLVNLGVINHVVRLFPGVVHYLDVVFTDLSLQESC